VGERAKLTAFEEHVLLTMAMSSNPWPPAHLSGFVWPNNSRVGRGAAPGTGLVRPMLAALARLKKKGMVFWRSYNGNPVTWELTAAGVKRAYELKAAPASPTTEPPTRGPGGEEGGGRRG